MGSPVSSKLCISSYNSTGFGLSAKNYVNTLLLFSDILCVQEHFLLDGNEKNHSNTNKLVNHVGTNHDISIVPAHKNTNQINRVNLQLILHLDIFALHIKFSKIFFCTQYKS